MSIETTFNRPVRGTLHVHLANGEKWEATAEDLDNFGLVKRHDAYMTFDDHLRKVLHTAGLIGREVTEAHVNPLRYLVEIAICHPHLLAHQELRETDLDIVKLERALAEAAKQEATR